MTKVSPESITTVPAVSLATAREKFAPTPAQSAHPQTDKEWAALRSGKPMSSATLVDGKHVEVSKATVQTAGFAAGFEATPDEVAALRACEAKMQGLMESLAGCGAAEVTRTWMKQ